MTTMTCWVCGRGMPVLDTYGRNVCPSCGAAYEHEEGQCLVDPEGEIRKAVVAEREACAFLLERRAAHYTRLLADCTDEVSQAFGRARSGECLEGADSIRKRGKP